MAQKQFTTSAINIAVLGNRILQNYRASDKKEMYYDNNIYKELTPIIESVNKSNNVYQEALRDILNEFKCGMRNDIIMYAGDKPEEAKEAVKQVEERKALILDAKKKVEDGPVTIKLEIETFNHLEKSFNSALDKIIEIDQKKENSAELFLQPIIKKIIEELEEAIKMAEAVKEKK